MKIDYDVRKNGDIVQLILRTVEEDGYDLVANQTFNIKDLPKAGNVIDQNTMPMRLCYILLRGFHERIAKQIVKASQYVYDTELQDKMLRYSKELIAGNKAVVSQEMFEQLLEDAHKAILG